MNAESVLVDHCALKIYIKIPFFFRLLLRSGHCLEEARGTKTTQTSLDVLLHMLSATSSAIKLRTAYYH